MQYKGAPLEAAKGPGLGCFSVGISAGFLIATLVILLFAGQTIIFLLRLVAADRRAEGRRRPMRSATRTVGELEDATGGATRDAAEDRRPNDGVRE